jgi:hypothetical protein
MKKSGRTITPAHGTAGVYEGKQKRNTKWAARRKARSAVIRKVYLDLRSPSLDSALRASLRLSKIAPGDIVAALDQATR